jgi:tetratricopeptide (TPR) repeat protein
MRVAVLIAGFLTAWVGSARAEPVPARDNPAAQALFDEARGLLKAGEVEAACNKFEASQRMNPSPGTLLNLASCHETLGRLATAWSEYREALALARADRRADRMAYAQARIVALEPRLPRLAVELSPEAEAIAGLEVSRNGLVLDPAAFGVPLPVDPGRHVVEARAPGFLPFRAEVEAQEAVAVAVRVERLAAEPPPRPVDGVRAEPTPPLHPPSPPAIEAATFRTMGWISLAMGGAAAAVALGTTIYAVREDARASELGCGGRTCPTDDALQHADDARMAAVASVVLLPVSVALVGAGVVLVVLPGDAGERRAAIFWRGRF